MSCRPGICLLAALLLGGSVSCSRRAEPAAGRLAILRFENLTGDATWDWAGRALSEVMISSLAAAPGVSVLPSARLHGSDRALGREVTSAPGISAERTQALLGGATRIAYGEYELRGGRLQAHLTLEDPATGRVVAMASAGSGAGEVIGLAGVLARQVNSGARPYLTRNQEALRLYSTAIEAGPAPAAQALAGAIAADPDFAPPYLMLAQARIAARDTAGADAVLSRALSHAAAMPEAERARIQLDAALLRGDAAGRRTALAALARATPGDATVWRALGEDAGNRRQYRESVEAYRKAAALEPNDAATLNALGYAAAHAGDLAAARQALEQYGRLRPAEANPLDSLGDVHLYQGKLKEAEDYYQQAWKKDAAFLGGGTLFKAAWAHLLTGDAAGADAIAMRYLEARRKAGDPVVEYRQAQWEWIAGRRLAGYAHLQSFARAHHTGALMDMAARAYAQLALWDLALGERTRALAALEMAKSLAGPGSAGMTAMAGFLAQPRTTASEWSVRAERAFPQPAQAGFKNFALAYALLLNGEFAAAAPLLREMVQSGGPGADETLPVLLAWAWLETGKAADAAPLLAANPIPSPDGVTPFTVMHFPRLLYLRGRLAEAQQNRAAAAQAYRAFLELSGPTPLVWGEEKRAREFVR